MRAGLRRYCSAQRPRRHRLPAPTAWRTADGQHARWRIPSEISLVHAPAALAGVPAVALPCGFDSRRLPLSVQIMGPPFEDATVLRAAHAYEQATKRSGKLPPWPDRAGAPRLDHG
jgi:Asp-tRNA(Asn)/Glu-tRNA(Gln) amidotransferase A subunit family amidase